MHIQRHHLLSPSLGTQRYLHSFHYGERGPSGQKVYLQASLHADELPGMLVLHHLRALLAAAESRGELRGELVLVPVANPIGLSQWLLYDQQGRFELTSGSNFNRDYPDFTPQLLLRLDGRLGTEAEANTRLMRTLLREMHNAQLPRNELESLRHTLIGLALDADVVLDLHCDSEALPHLYTESPFWSQAEPLARYLGTQANLLATGSGGWSFDEALSQPWWRVAQHYGSRYPIQLACLSATVELRGEADVGHEWARQDAANVYAFLQYRGLIAGEVRSLPPLQRPATPLAGSETLVASQPGIMVYHKRLGEWVEAGEVVVELIDPLEGQTSLVKASVSGLLYARDNRRYAVRGMGLAKIAGAVAFRSGALLSP